MLWIVAIAGVIGILIVYAKQASASPTCSKCGGGCQDSGGSSQCGCNITTNIDTWPSGDNIWNICKAIARQEGANVSGSKPDRYNNPGDITDKVGGYPHDSEGLTMFPSKSEGWQALYNKWVTILNGGSSVYNPNGSWYDIGSHWAADPNWTNGVCAILGVDPNTTPAQYVSGTDMSLLGVSGCCITCG